MRPENRDSTGAGTMIVIAENAGAVKPEATFSPLGMWYFVVRMRIAQVDVSPLTKPPRCAILIHATRGRAVVSSSGSIP